MLIFVVFLMCTCVHIHTYARMQICTYISMFTHFHIDEVYPIGGGGGVGAGEYRFDYFKKVGTMHYISYVSYNSVVCVLHPMQSDVMFMSKRSTVMHEKIKCVTPLLHASYLICGARRIALAHIVMILSKRCRGMHALSLMCLTILSYVCIITNVSHDSFVCVS